MAKKRVFAGIRATGQLHLGNYMGGIKGMLALQEDPQYETAFMVVDVHAITTPYDRKTLKDTSYNVILDYLACGLDPKKSLITKQSLVPQHAEGAFYLSSLMSVARMQHLPTYKEKVKQHPNNVTMALLNYPILMAADILLYKTFLVPVGIDQEPHLEVAREIARKLNSLAGEDLFPEPQRFATKGEYVPSLTGEGKMSKSVEGSYITLQDSLSEITEKIAKMPTDTGKGNSVPTEGSVKNLLHFVDLFEGPEKKLFYENQYVEAGIKYSELKNDLAQAIYTELKPIQEKRAELEKKPDYIQKVIEQSAAKAREITQETLDQIKTLLGFQI